MAKDETRKDLLQTLTEGRMGVPTRSDERGVEPVEPVESSRDTERGKSPEEVVGERETQRAITEVEKTKVPQKYKVRIDDGSGEPVIKELSVEQLAEQGLLDKLITSANQLPSLSRKHQELLERVASKETTKDKEPPKRELTPAEFWNHLVTVYQPAVEEGLRLNIENGWIETDLAEAYPQAIHTFFTRIFHQQDLIEELRTKLAAVIGWIEAEAGQRETAKVETLFDGVIEALAKKGDGDDGDPLFKDLRNPGTLKNFKEWIVTSLDPKIGSLTVENMEKFWFAFNAQGILDLTKQSAKKAAEVPPPKRRAANDGSSVRLGLRESEKEKPLLERLTDLVRPEASN